MGPVAVDTKDRCPVVCHLYLCLHSYVTFTLRPITLSRVASRHATPDVDSHFECDSNLHPRGNVFLLTRVCNTHVDSYLGESGGTPDSRSKHSRSENPRFEVFEGFPWYKGTSATRSKSTLGSSPRKFRVPTSQIRR